MLAMRPVLGFLRNEESAEPKYQPGRVHGDNHNQ